MSWQRSRPSSKLSTTASPEDREMRPTASFRALPHVTRLRVNWELKLIEVVPVHVRRQLCGWRLQLRLHMLWRSRQE